MLGIDVSKATLAASLVDPVTRTPTWSRTVSNAPEGIRSLLAACPPGVPWVLEPTGRYSLGVVKQARTAERTVLLAPPRKAKAFLAAIQSRAKTDRVDSYGLALDALGVPLSAYPVSPPAPDELGQLLKARRGLSQSIMQLTQQQGELPAAALAGAIADLQAHRATLDEAIAAATTADAPLAQQVAALDAVPGIGPVIATTLAVCLTSRTFPDSDAFVAYAGLDTRVKDSGTLRGRRTLSKQGDAALRQLLYLAAQANLRTKNSPFKAQYVRERAKGLVTTAALCAVARKLARVSWSIVRHHTPYDPARVNQQRPKPTDTGSPPA